MRFPVVVVGLALVAVALAPASACVGARALAMGGAFTGLADDASATYWNPAALVDLQDGEARLTAEVTAANRAWINYQEYASASGSINRDNAIGVSWVRFRLRLAPDVVSNQDWYWLSAGTRVGRTTSMGANIRVTNDSMDAPGLAASTGTGVDVALYQHLGQRWTVGLLVQNANRPKTKISASGVQVAVTEWIRNWRPGAAVRLNDGVIVSAEVYDAADEQHRAFRIGAEKRFDERRFALRAGWYGNANAPTLGAGIWRGRGSLDAAWLGGDLDNTWIVSGAVTF